LVFWGYSCWFFLEHESRRERCAISSTGPAVMLPSELVKELRGVVSTVTAEYCRPLSVQEAKEQMAGCEQTGYLVVEVLSKDLGSYCMPCAPGSTRDVCAQMQDLQTAKRCSKAVLTNWGSCLSFSGVGSGGVAVGRKRGGCGWSHRRNCRVT